MAFGNTFKVTVVHPFILPPLDGRVGVGCLVGRFKIPYTPSHQEGNFGLNNIEALRSGG
jgi:hypothetical protein